MRDWGFEIRESGVLRHEGIHGKLCQGRKDQVLLRIPNPQSRIPAVMAARQRGHDGLLHMQPILRLVDGDAAGRIHHRVGRLDVAPQRQAVRSEEHTSELQSLMRISYAVFCLKKKTKDKYTYQNTTQQ